MTGIYGDNWLDYLTLSIDSITITDVDDFVNSMFSKLCFVIQHFEHQFVHFEGPSVLKTEYSTIFKVWKWNKIQCMHFEGQCVQVENRIFYTSEFKKVCNSLYLSKYCQCFNEISVYFKR